MLKKHDKLKVKMNHEDFSNISKCVPEPSSVYSSIYALIKNDQVTLISSKIFSKSFKLQKNLGGH